MLETGGLKPFVGGRGIEKVVGVLALVVSCTSRSLHLSSNCIHVLGVFTFFPSLFLVLDADQVFEENPRRVFEEVVRSNQIEKQVAATRRPSRFYGVGMKRVGIGGEGCLKKLPEDGLIVIRQCRDIDT